MRNPAFLARAASWLWLPVIAATLTACNNLIDTEVRFISDAQVAITGQTPIPMLLITSKDFTATRAANGGLNVTYLLADTAGITLPFNQTYNLGRTDRFVVKLENADSESTATFDIRVLLDGELWDQAAGTMKDSSLELVFYQPARF